MCERVFPGKDMKAPLLVSSLDHQHVKLRRQLNLPEEFVLHSLRHTMLTRLGESEVDAFTIMKIAGHSSVTVSQRYVHPSSEAMIVPLSSLRFRIQKPEPVQKRGKLRRQKRGSKDS